jgi:hypothetical protein
MFCRGGALGGKRALEKDEKRGFSEQDQEDLYNTAHVRLVAPLPRCLSNEASLRKKAISPLLDFTNPKRRGVQEKAIKGKQGLGRSSLPKKVAGVRFEGTKTKIAESGDEEEEKEVEEAAPSGRSDGQDSGGCEGKGARKWKKIALRVLREGGGSMKVKQLKKKALEHAGVEKSDAATAGAALLKRVESSSAFRVEGKTVALAK